MKFVLARRVVLLTAFLAAVLFVVGGVGANSIESVDTEGGGAFTSLVLDENGYPVVSYYDATHYKLKVLHCNDANCAGGDESIQTVDATDGAGQYTSLALDENGYPVVSYYDVTNYDLKVLHCNDPNCAGGDESIVSVDTEGNVGGATSLALDGDGNPVVSYQDDMTTALKLLHCNDPNCADGDESIQTVDAEGSTGGHASLALDVNGYPVVSYYDLDNGDLKVVHCNDANCAGGDESIESVDTAGDVGWFTSLALDENGYPVASYYDLENGDLKVVHCNDANCADGDESIESVDTEGNVGLLTSLALDADGNPVVSYYDGANLDLKVAHCNDPDCTGGDESIMSGDTAENVGAFSSLALDAEGNPVVSYFDVINYDLKLLHCSNVYCSPQVAPEVEAGADVTVDEGAPVTFGGSASDANDDELTLAWEFGDGATANDHLTPAHAYGDDGVFTVTLTATDEYGLAASDTLTVTVENVAPAVEAGQEVTVIEDVALAFSGSFADPGVDDTHTIEWFFGDGGTATDTLTPVHTYAAPGSYAVMLRVTDDDGGVGMDMLTVTVEEGAPVEWGVFLPGWFGGGG